MPKTETKIVSLSVAVAHDFAAVEEIDWLDSYFNDGYKVKHLAPVPVPESDADSEPRIIVVLEKE